MTKEKIYWDDKAEKVDFQSQAANSEQIRTIYYNLIFMNWSSERLLNWYPPAAFIIFNEASLVVNDQVGRNFL